MLKYARHVMYPSQPWIRSNASKRAMTIGKVYESSALCYLADQKIVTDMQTQHIQAPDDDQRRLIQIIKTINMYPILTEQYKAFNGWTTPTHYQAATLPDCTCFGKNIPVLPDAIGKYNGKPVVVEIKCPSRIYQRKTTSTSITTHDGNESIPLPKTPSTWNTSLTATPLV